ncbi:MAG: polysaccharide deacetylase family protein [Polyangiaceae bacterium]
MCYHRTGELEFRGAFDGAIIDATPAQFDQQIELLTREFRVVGLDEVVAHIERGAKLPPNPVLITFDDGYRDCLHVTAPILKRHGARGAFFIPTSFVNERKMFWWDRYAWILENARTEVLELTYPMPMVLRTTTAEERQIAHRKLTDLTKKHYGLDLVRFVDELETAAATHLERAVERRMVDETLMTWDEVRALASEGMSIGSHSHSHRVLQTIPSSDYERELVGSRRELEERLDTEVRSLAYPVGYPLGENPELRRAVREAGYAVGFSCRAGAFGGGFGRDPYDVPRFLMDMSYRFQLLRAMITVPTLGPRSTIDIA